LNGTWFLECPHQQIKDSSQSNSKQFPSDSASLSAEGSSDQNSSNFIILNALLIFVVLLQ